LSCGPNCSRSDSPTLSSPTAYDAPVRGMIGRGVDRPGDERRVLLRNDAGGPSSGHSVRGAARGATRPNRRSDMADAQIVVSGLTQHYKAGRAVDNLSFVVEPGRVTGFLGPNGAGKTTTLRMILNLVTPTAGTATIGGRRYVDLDQPLRTVGAVLEASAAHRGR